MTRVDFYLTQNKPLITACKLAEKAARQGHHIYIHTADEPQAQQLDKLLWTFNQSSFVPHALVDVNKKINAADKVMIGHDHEPEFKHDVMINLAATIPAFFSRFERVAEIVSNDEEQRQQARQRFKYYRDRGYELDTHEIQG